MKGSLAGTPYKGSTMPNSLDISTLIAIEG
jgi:hypothetical protein